MCSITYFNRFNNFIKCWTTSPDPRESLFKLETNSDMSPALYNVHPELGLKIGLNVCALFVSVCGANIFVCALHFPALFEKYLARGCGYGASHKRARGLIISHFKREPNSKLCADFCLNINAIPVYIFLRCQFVLLWIV